MTTIDEVLQEQWDSFFTTAYPADKPQPSENQKLLMRCCFYAGIMTGTQAVKDIMHFHAQNQLSLQQVQDYLKEQYRGGKTVLLEYGLKQKGQN